MRRAATSNVGIWVLGLGGAAALFLLGRKAAAAATPAASERNARVLQNVNTRSGAGTNNAIIGAANTPPNDAIAGSTVRVIRTGISGAGAREWWEIVTPSGGHGFAAAVNTDGTRNLELI